ncbi:Hypothetical protein HDN1F_33530 [gamma proteobacterium HdN1]|nr:Hypothetical protein HDN1F_33530 [gamma proteobacterium HdN1]
MVLIMKTRKLRWSVVGIFVSVLLACGVAWLMPDWERDLYSEGNRQQEFLLTAQDQQSLYHVRVLPPKKELLITQLDLDGEILEQKSYALQSDGYHSLKLVRGNGDEFYVYGEDSKTDGLFALYVDLAGSGGVSEWHSNNPDSRYMAVKGSFYDGKLVFASAMYSPQTGYKVFATGVGVVNKNGQLEKFSTFPDFSFPNLVQVLNNGNIQLVVGIRDSNSKLTAFVELDNNLNLVQRHDQPMAVYVNAIAPAVEDDSLIAFIHSSDDKGKAVRLSLTGNILQEVPPGHITTWPTRILPISNGFFAYGGSEGVCFFDRNLEQQWCSSLDFMKPYDGLPALNELQITPDNELLVSVSRSYVAVDGPLLRTEADANAKLELGLTLTGEERYDTLYSLYSASEKRVAQFKTRTFKQRGALYICERLVPCAKPETIQPGACDSGHQGSVVLPGRSIYSVVEHCDGDKYNNPNTNITSKLLHWTP